MSETTSQPDLVDVLLKLGLFATFVGMGICVWLIRRAKNKRNNPDDKPPLPPES